MKMEYYYEVLGTSTYLSIWILPILTKVTEIRCKEAKAEKRYY